MGEIKLSRKAEEVVNKVRTSLRNRKKARGLFESYTSLEDTKGRARLYRLSEIAPEEDISKMTLITPEEVAEGKEGLFFQNRYNIPEGGQKEYGACGRDVSEVYVLAYSRDKTKQIIEGPDCILQLAEDLSKFDKGKSLEVVKKKKEEKKERKRLEEISLEEITEEGFGEMEKLLEEESLPFKEALRRSRNYQEAAREVERAKKVIKDAFSLYTEFGRRSFAYFDLDDTAPDKAKETGGNIRKWLRAEMVGGRLPPNIDYLARRYFDDRIEGVDNEIKALYLYGIASLPVGRKALVNEDELDLRFFELVTSFKHYGDKKKFLEAEEERIEEMKKEILKRRGGFSEKQKEYFKDEEGLLRLIEESKESFLEMVYEKAGKVQISPEIRELFKKEQVTILDTLKYQKVDVRLREKRKSINERYYLSLGDGLGDFLGELELQGGPLELWMGFDEKKGEFYEKFLREEYRALKELMKVGFLGGNDLKENVLDNLSVSRFKENWEKVVVLMRKYYYNKETGEDVFKNKDIYLKEFFKDYLKWELEGLLERLENTEFGEIEDTQREHLRRLRGEKIEPKAEGFKKKYLGRMRKLSEHGLFDVSLVKEIKKIQPAFFGLKGIEELGEMVEKAKELLKDPVFKKLELDLGKRYISRKAAGLVKKLASEEVREAASKVKELVEGCRLSLGGIPKEERERFSLYTMDFRLEDLLQPLISKEGFREPEKVLECFGFYKKSFKVYSPEEHKGFHGRFGQVVKAEHLHDFIARDFGRGSKGYLKECWERFNKEVKAGRRVFLSEGFQEGFVGEIYKRMFEAEVPYVGEYREIEGLCSGKSKEVLSWARKGKGRARVYVYNLDFNDRIKAGLTELSDYDFGKRAWFGYALDLSKEDSVMPLFELRNKVNTYRKRTKKKIWVEVKEERKKEYSSLGEVVEEGSREAYSSLKEGEEVKVIVKRAAEGLPERNRYFLGRGFTGYCLRRGAELVDYEGKKAVMMKRDRKGLDVFLGKLLKHNQGKDEYHQFEVELVKDVPNKTNP